MSESERKQSLINSYCSDFAISLSSTTEIRCNWYWQFHKKLIIEIEKLFFYLFRKLSAHMHLRLVVNMIKIAYHAVDDYFSFAPLTWLLPQSSDYAKLFKFMEIGGKRKKEKK